MCYADALAWLYGVQPIGIKLGLEGTRRLLDEMSIDTSRFTVWHVAGTNGKGSVCTFLESVLRASGRRTGLFTSPHLVSYRERIRVGHVPVEATLLADHITQIRELVQGWDPHPTFFELTTALAFRMFQDAEVEELVLETGLGGRLDSTNAVPSNVSILTSIDFDHCKWLGDTLAAIAAEKAGIFKPGVPAIVPGNLADEALAVIQCRAAEVGAPLRIVGQPLGEPWEIGLRGSHQRWNAALAVEALCCLRPEIPDEVLRRGLSDARWPARFQVFAGDDRTVVVDGAHNPAAAVVLARTWREEFGEQRATLVFGTVEEKDSEAILTELRGIAWRVLFTSVPTQRGKSAAGLAAELGLAPGDEVIEDAGQALARADSGLVLVAGSLFLAGKALELLGAAEVFEPSLQ